MNLAARYPPDPGDVTDGTEFVIATVGVGEVRLRRKDGKGWLVLVRRPADGAEHVQSGYESWSVARGEALQFAFELLRQVLVAWSRGEDPRRTPPMPAHTIANPKPTEYSAIER